MQLRALPDVHSSFIEARLVEVERRGAARRRRVEVSLLEREHEDDAFLPAERLEDLALPAKKVHEARRERQREPGKKINGKITHKRVPEVLDLVLQLGVPGVDLKRFGHLLPLLEETLEG